MEVTQLGSSDLLVSRVGLGCNNFVRRLDAAATRAVIDAALDMGVAFLDTADVYGTGDSERFIGEALAATHGNQRQAAFQLGVLPTTLHEKMKRLGMIAPLGRKLRLAHSAAPAAEASGESLAS